MASHFFAFLALMVGTAILSAEPVYTIDHATVTVEKRQDQSWCVLDSKITTTLSESLSSILQVIEDYNDYPKIFPRIAEASSKSDGDATLLTEKVVVSALGITNVNRFTLRIVKTENQQPQTLLLSWTQEWTDGSIDSLWGSWTLTDVGTSEQPLTKLIYHTHSAVPMRFFGQNTFIGLFLGGETKASVEAVAKNAGAR